MSKKNISPVETDEQNNIAVTEQVVTDETVTEQVEATENASYDDEKLTVKDIFVKVGRAIRNYFVRLGIKIRDFFVNLWRKTVRFFHNVGIFFKMLFTFKKKQPAEVAADVDGEQTSVTEENHVVKDANVTIDGEMVSEATIVDETEKETEQAEQQDEVEAMRSRIKDFFRNLFRKRTKDEWKTLLLGNNEQKGLVQQIISYALLILFGFVYAYPMLYMLGYSLMGESDVLNPMVNYLPTEWQWSNYKEAAQTLNFFNTLIQTAYVSVLPSILQTAACGLTAYGLARFQFPGKKIVFGLIVLTFIIPPQLTMMPQLIIFTNVGIAGNILAFMVPAALGQGIKSAVFILIFYQFFRGIPDSVVEAAKIDGANAFQIFWKIGVRSAVPAILLSFLLSVVWYYNETVLSQIYLGGNIKMLPLELEKFQSTYEQLFGSTTSTGKSVNEAIYMAGTLLNVLPLIIMYFFTQRYFVDGIDKAGITGE